MASAQVCPVVGTTNTVLPPQHPEFDINKPGQVCPVTKATTDHHDSLQKHPKVVIQGDEALNDATSCPVLKDEAKSKDGKKLDEDVCPVVGTATTVLPPDHPDMSKAKAGDICPKTNASIEHHKGVIHQHPPVAGSDIKQCPVVGARA